jgi:peptidoglycan/xylan/chitin deacetylase (PgdA/CDA1 family)
MKNKKLLSVLTIIVIAIFISIYSISTSYAVGTTLTDVAGSSSSLNLIPNPSVEAVTGTLPTSWLQAGYGTNNHTFNYPVTGLNSASAVNVTISTYTDGDAKWYFTEVPVTPARSYLYTDNYISTTPTQVVAEYFDANHVHLSYAGFITVPASPVSPANSWGSFNTTFIPPTGAAFMTVYHLLNGVGSLTTDNFSLTEVPLPQPFDKGYVSLTFDDGFLNHYQNALPILATANIKGTFFIVSHLVSGLSISNPSLETANGASPADWSNTGGTNATYTYPVTGHTGASAAQVSSTTSGSNAAWFFNPISVLNDSVYSFSDWYKSTTNTELVAMITKVDGTTVQADVTDATANTLGASVSLPSTNNTWAQANAFFYVPVDAKTITIENRLVGTGSVTIDDTTLGVNNYMNSTQVKALDTAGQEIGGHTQSHKDLTTLSPADAQTEINGGRNDLLNGGITSVLPFDYPYGTYSPSVQQIVQSAGFTSARTVTPGFNGKDSDKFALKAQSVNADTTLATVQSWVTQAAAQHTWLILVFHEIQTDLTNSPYGTTPANLQAIVNYLKTNNIATETLSQGASLMNGGVVVPPTVTLNSIAITTPATKLSYTVGDALDISGLVVTGTYSDSTTKVETVAAVNVTGFNSTAAATGQVLTVTVGGKTTTYTVNITATPTATLNSIAITTPATKLSYVVGDPLSIAGLVVTGTYSDSTTKVETVALANVTGFNSTAPVTGQVLTVTVGGKTTTYMINITAAPVVTPPVVTPPSQDNGGGGGSSYNRGGSFIYQLPQNKAVTPVAPVTPRSPKHGDSTGKVLGADTYKFNTNLKFGMKKDNGVKELQTRLQKEGVYSGVIDGNFGTQTRSAIKKYQALKKLPTTGFVGPQTRGILNAA